MNSNAERDTWNRGRYLPGTKKGHYESYFQRANHPERPLAFWIRYTIFSPKGNPDAAIGELWAIFFDGEAGTITAAKQEFPIRECAFSGATLDVKIGKALLKNGLLVGTAASKGNTLRWNLNYDGDSAPLLLLERPFYEKGFPKAKALVGTPHAVYNGHLTVNETEVTIDEWVGSQNHNWGIKHTDQYAWGQVAGFDNAPDAFLECSTARVKIGPLWTPWLTLMVLRVQGQSYELNSLSQALKAHGKFDYFTWNFDSSQSGIRIYGMIQAPASAFVGLNYYNPPGGSKTCLNTKIAHCNITLERPGAELLNLSSEHRAAFEILTDDHNHGVAVVA